MTTQIETLKSIRIEAGTRRDGTAEATLNAAIKVVNDMAYRCRDLSSARYLKIDAERQRMREMMPFCRLHDAAARGEIDNLEHQQRLEALRNA